MVKIVTEKFVVKASTNFHCFGKDDEVFRASWNVAIVEYAIYRSDGSWPSMRIASKDQSASNAAPIILET